MAGSFGVGHEVMFHTDSLFLLEVDPPLWEEGVWVWEYVRVGLVEYGSHADDGLRLSEKDRDNGAGGIEGWRGCGVAP